MGFLESILSVLLTAKGIALAVVAFGLMVIAHEFGHFLAAKLVGVRVDCFSLGFGWKLWGHKWGQTEYRVSAVPLGGYVKMAGGDEGEEATGAPDEFVSKTPGQRAVVLVAGPIFSILFGIPLAVAMLLIGREVPQAVVSHVVVDSAAWNAGVKQGDRIVRVDGSDVATFDDLREAVIESPPDLQVPVAIERGGQPMTLVATREKQQSLGVMCAAVTLELQEVAPESPAAEAGLRPGDVMVSANGVRLRDWAHLRSLILASPAKPMRLAFRRDGAEQSIDVLPNSIGQNDPGFTIRLPNEVGSVRAGFPAEGKLEVGDRIVAVNGEAVDGWGQIEDAVLPGAKKAAFAVQRGEQKLTVDLALEDGTWLGDSAGIAPAAAFVVDAVHGETEPPLHPGDRIVGANGEDLAPSIRAELLYAPLSDVLDAFGKAKTLRVQRGGGEPFDVALRPGKRPVAKRPVGQLGIGPVHLVLLRKYGLAHVWGPALKETQKAGMLVYVVLKKLFTRDVDAKSIAGPLGIFQIMYVSATQGFAHFLWLVHLLTVNIGLLNLLPIPPLDGGRLVMVGYEKLRGRRMGRKLQEVILLAGVGIVLMIFVFATFNDVRRLFF